jgi:hypothetical protein
VFELLTQHLTVEGVASAIVGFVILGMISKRAFDGYIEARAKFQQQARNPMLTMAAAVWDREQQEKFLLTLDRMATAMEAQALHQGALASKQAQETQDLLADIAERVNSLTMRRSPRRRPARKT